MAEARAEISVGHVGMTVRDMDKSVEFYRDGVGLEVLWDYAWITPTEMQESRELFRELRPQLRRQVLLRMPGGPGQGGMTMLALSTFEGAELQGEGIRLDDVGISHLSFLVPDMEEFRQRMNKIGAKQIHGDMYVDPDGVMVQFEDPKFQAIYLDESWAAEKAAAAAKAAAT